MNGKTLKFKKIKEIKVILNNEVYHFPGIIEELVQRNAIHQHLLTLQFIEYLGIYFYKPHLDRHPKYLYFRRDETGRHREVHFGKFLNKGK